MHNFSSNPERSFGETLRELRLMTGCTTAQEMVDEVSKCFPEEKPFGVDSLRSWETERNYLSANSLKVLITFFLKKGTFTEGKEQEQAKDFWEKARHAYKDKKLSKIPFNEKWFAATLIEVKNSSPATLGILVSQEETVQEIKEFEVPDIENYNIEQKVAVWPDVKEFVPSDNVVSNEVKQPYFESNNENGSLKEGLKLKEVFSNNLQKRFLWAIVILVGLISLLSIFLVLNTANKTSGAATTSTAASVSVSAVASVTSGSVISTSTKPPLFSFKDSLKDDKYLKEAIYCMAFSSNSKTLVSVSGNSKINFWRVNANGILDKTPVKSLTGYQTGTNDRASWVVYSKDGKRLAVASGSLKSTDSQKWEIAVWEVDSDGLPKTEQPFQKINPAAEHVPAFGFSYDGKIIASPGPNKSVVLWDVDTGKQLTVLSGHSGQAREFSFSRDSSRLIVASGDGTVKLWDAKNGMLLKTFDDHPGGAWTATFSPDEKLVASGGKDKAINVAEVDSTKKVAAFTDTKQNGETYSVIFSPNGKILATAGDDGDVILWNVDTGETYPELKGKLVINNLAFSPDGKYLVSGTESPDNVIINLYQVVDNSKTK